jgi:hypothetical protein
MVRTCNCCPTTVMTVFTMHCLSGANRLLALCAFLLLTLAARR